MTQTTGPCRVLLGIDGSEHSFAAAALLADLPLPPECQVTALGVFLPREASFHARLLPPLAKVKNDLEVRNIKVTTETIAGNPAEVLSEFAEKNDVDLIVLGAKGLRATLGIFLGGVAQQLIEYSNRPVLVVRAPYTGLEHVLLVTDGSSYSDQAITYLSRFPLPSKSRLTVLHVLPPYPFTDVTPVLSTWTPRHTNALLLEPMPGVEFKDIADEEEKKGKALIERTILQIQQALPESCKELSITGALRRGDAATEIIHYVADHQVNLVIAGSRGLSQVQSWLLGSVSRKLVHYANCSVLIVRHQPPGER